MCVKLNLLFNSEMKVSYITYVLKHCINIKTVCPNYILELRSTNSHFFQVFIREWVKIEIVINNNVCWSLLL